MAFTRLHLLNALKKSNITTPLKLGLRYNSTIKLSHDSYYAENSNKNLIILHGLFGSKQNWRGLSKALNKELKMNVFALDLRNHGDSEHSEIMDYSSLAGDVEKFIIDQKLDKQELVLMGHSMGGRVAMSLALERSKQQRINNLNKLIIVDVAPFPMDIGTSFSHYIKQMKLIDEARLKKQSEADKMLIDGDIDKLAIRQFLLTNYKKQDDGTYKFRNPLDVLEKQLKVLAHMRQDLLKEKTELDTLFIGGSKSNYLPNGIEPKLKEIFSNSTLKYLDAGHWVHSEKPKEFLDLVNNFIKQ